MLGFGGTLLLLAVFIRLETAADHPMLDISLFRDRRFSAAATAVTISTFALFGFIFLITQYFQFVRDYTALGTGTRILPVAAAIAGSSILGGFLAPRVGVKAVVTVGMAMLGGAFVWISTMAVDASYAGAIVPQMLLMGTGLGLISTPATESIMQVLPPARAGVGSAVNDATRELGGTLGVAVVGSLFSSLYAARLVEQLDGRLPGRPAARGRGVGRRRGRDRRPGRRRHRRDGGRVHVRPRHGEPGHRPAVPGRGGLLAGRPARQPVRAAGRKDAETATELSDREEVTLSR